MDAFSRRISAELFDRFPEWRSLAESKREVDGTEYLLLRITPPEASKADRPLLITTSGREITVGFDLYHSHFDSFVDDPETTFGSESAQTFIEKILSEKVVVVSYWLGRQWLGSVQETANKPSREVRVSAQADRKRIRSWLGTFSKDVPLR